MWVGLLTLVSVSSGRCGCGGGGWAPGSIGMAVASLHIAGLHGTAGGLAWVG